MASRPSLQKRLENMGKKPAITVVAKAEFAQSYSAQTHSGRVVERLLVMTTRLCV